MKRKKSRITLQEAIARIPHDECYCCDSRTCPYHTFRKCSKTKYKKLSKEVITQFNKPYLEWCTFLNAPLYIQDGCKDCEINCDYPEEYFNRFYEEEKEKAKKGQENAIRIINAIENDTWKSYPFKQRISKGAIEYYKERFPEEKDYIDKIYKEDVETLLNSGKQIN